MAGPSQGGSSRSIDAVKAVSLPVIAARWWEFAEAERQSLALWLPVAFAIGVGLWFALPWQVQRWSVAILFAGIGLAAWLGRWRPVAALALLALAGMGAAEWRSVRVAAPVLAFRGVHQVDGRVVAVENRVNRDQSRLLVAPEEGALPPLIRLTVRGRADPEIAPGARISVRAMLSPPAGAAVPGGYDFARQAWFAGIGATGFPLGPVIVTAPAPPPKGLMAWTVAARAGLTTRITAAVPGAAGAMAAAFVTGDQSAIPLPTAQAMRDSGLAHLLSISGLHIAVVVGGAIFLVRRTLALVPWIALRWPVKGIAVAAAALIGVGYTILAGAEVPTVRTILATLIVLFGMAIGREAFSLRLLATAAILILAVRPEALLGASFQLSFAAVIAIVALYESPLGRKLTTPVEDEGPARWLGRQAAALLVSGLVAELALSSIGLFHFQRAGLYGVFANLLAIPWSSFVVMPALMLALLAESLGLGSLAWPLVGWAMGGLIALAETTAALPGAVVRTPAMPVAAFAAIITGGLWLTLWRSRLRWWGVAPIVVGLVMAMATRPADLLVSSDGRHAAVQLADGRLAFLRSRTGPFLRSVWSDALAADGEAHFAELPGMACSQDSCVAVIRRGDRSWRLLATLSRDFIDRSLFEPACAKADIVISDRRMPGWCQPRWQRFDRDRLVKTGAVAVWLESGRVVTANDRLGDHPWRPQPYSGRQRPERDAPGRRH
jgi:competence protein ComEC